MQISTESHGFMTNPEITRDRDRICRSWEIYGAITSALELECLHHIGRCSRFATLDLCNVMMLLLQLGTQLSIKLHFVMKW